MTDEKSLTVCFSGHRPEKLPHNGDEYSHITKAIKSMLYKEISDSIGCGCNRFITGLARGVDLWAGEMVLEIKAKYKDIKLIAVSPFKGHGGSLKGNDKWIYGNIAARADEVIFISENYTKQCMKQRNEYMVDNSGRLIAVVADYNSGTGQTISYARKSGIMTKIIDVGKFYSSLDQLSFFGG